MKRVKCRRQPRSTSPTNSLQKQGTEVVSWMALPSLASLTPSLNFAFLTSFTCEDERGVPVGRRGGGRPPGGLLQAFRKPKMRGSALR